MKKLIVGSLAVFVLFWASSPAQADFFSVAVDSPVAFSFEVEVTGGEMGLSDETTDVGYFTMEEMETLDLMEHHRERIRDALKNSESTFVK